MINLKKVGHMQWRLLIIMNKIIIENDIVVQTKLSSKVKLSFLEKNEDLLDKILYPNYDEDMEDGNLY